MSRARTAKQQMRDRISRASRKKNLMAKIDWEQDNLVSNMFPWASRLSARRSQPITNFLSADQLAAAEASADDMSPAQAELALMNYAANNPEPAPTPAPFVGALKEWTTDQPINAPSTFIPGSDVLPAGAPPITEKVDNFLNGGGGSNWVGGNSTWIGRDNNVIAPHVSDVFSDHQNSNVFTPHYETGEPLGVMTRNQRRAYEAAAAAAGF